MSGKMRDLNKKPVLRFPWEIFAISSDILNEHPNMNDFFLLLNVYIRTALKRSRASRSLSLSFFLLSQQYHRNSKLDFFFFGFYSWSVAHAHMGFALKVHRACLC
jgi:hypothetical protein